MLNEQLKNRSMKNEVKVGMKFINPTKRRWPYQVSEIDEKIVVISWIENKVIKSTLYEMWEVVRYLDKKIWEVADPSTNMNHPVKSN